MKKLTASTVKSLAGEKTANIFCSIIYFLIKHISTEMSLYFGSFFGYHCEKIFLKGMSHWNIES